MQGISINLERNAFKGEKSRIVSCDICQVWAILVSMSPSFPRYKEGTGGRGQIEPGLPVGKPQVIMTGESAIFRTKMPSVALLDDGSGGTFIKTETMERLGINGQDTTLLLTTMRGTQEIETKV